jgi:hypothetical protein
MCKVIGVCLQMKQITKPLILYLGEELENFMRQVFELNFISFLYT